jgi:hypothetical protein
MLGIFERLQLMEGEDGHLTNETNAAGILQDLRMSFPCDSMEYELLESVIRSRTQNDEKTGDLGTLMIAFGK